MLSHVTLGTNDFARAIAFYDALLAPLGWVRRETHATEAIAGYAAPPEEGRPFWVMQPLDGGEATVGNGTTTAFDAPDRATVRAWHAAGLAAGATEVGAPGLRPHYHPDYYGAYLRDLDGHKLCCVCHRAER